MFVSDLEYLYDVYAKIYIIEVYLLQCYFESLIYKLRYYRQTIKYYSSLRRYNWSIP